MIPQTLLVASAALLAGLGASPVDRSAVAEEYIVLSCAPDGRYHLRTNLGGTAETEWAVGQCASNVYLSRGSSFRLVLGTPTRVSTIGQACLAALEQSGPGEQPVRMTLQTRGSASSPSAVESITIQPVDVGPVLSGWLFAIDKDWRRGQPGTTGEVGPTRKKPPR